VAASAHTHHLNEGFFLVRLRGNQNSYQHQLSPFWRAFWRARILLRKRLAAQFRIGTRTFQLSRGIDVER